MRGSSPVSELPSDKLTKKLILPSGSATTINVLLVYIFLAEESHQNPSACLESSVKMEKNDPFQFQSPMLDIYVAIYGHQVRLLRVEKLATGHYSFRYETSLKSFKCLQNLICLDVLKDLVIQCVLSPIMHVMQHYLHARYILAFNYTFLRGYCFWLQLTCTCKGS